MGQEIKMDKITFLELLDQANKDDPRLLKNSYDYLRSIKRSATLRPVVRCKWHQATGKQRCSICEVNHGRNT